MEMSPELEEVLRAARGVADNYGSAHRARLDVALQAYDESIKPQPIDGYLYWGVADEPHFSRNQYQLINPAAWNTVLKGTFVPSERIK